MFHRQLGENRSDRGEIVVLRRNRRSPPKKSEREYFVALLQRLLSGTEGDWDWDDLEYCKFDDPEFETMRLSIVECGTPPMTDKEWTASKHKIESVLKLLTE